MTTKTVQKYSVIKRKGSSSPIYKGIFFTHMKAYISDLVYLNDIHDLEIFVNVVDSPANWTREQLNYFSIPSV